MSTSESETTLYKVGHRVFLWGLLLKGINAVAEIVGGTLLLVFPASSLRGLITSFASWCAGFLPAGWTDKLTAFGAGLEPSAVLFAAWYLLSHGLIKVIVIICLLLRKLWAYPLGIVVFVGFGVYQTWEYFRAGGVLYLYLDVLDAALIALTAMEWRHAARQTNRPIS